MMGGEIAEATLIKRIRRYPVKDNAQGLTQKRKSYSVKARPLILSKLQVGVGRAMNEPKLLRKSLIRFF